MTIVINRYGLHKWGLVWYADAHTECVKFVN